MSKYVCIDIGGTFTDCVISAPDQKPQIFKSLSTPGAFERGFIDVLSVAAEAHGLTLRQLMEQTELVVHGTTVSTNALVENKVGRCGLILTAGHPDILLLREGPRKRSFDWTVDYPDPFVPRHLTREVRGRLDAKGREVAPVNEDDVTDAVEYFRARKVDAIAVSLMWSIVDGRHERAVRDVIARQWPEVPVTLGHELNPIQREYRRTISAAINAALHPTVSSYVGALSAALRDAGYTRDLLIANCIGGMMPAEEIVRKPIYSVMSGPTLAPIAARYLTDETDVIVADMGGTTFDISAVRGGRIVVTPESMIGHDMLGIPKIDVRSIGAGGGSIAWVDPGGLLKVGPQSAGADPGPACYGRGGTEPTVTDANVVLGIISPEHFLGGEMRLDAAAAEAALARIAERLGVTVTEAAYAIHTACNHNMVGAIENITVNEGIDPRESYLVSGGGATACHIAEMAQVLGIKRFLIPKLSAGLSALGGLVSDLRFNELGTLQTDAKSFDLDGVNALLETLRRRGDALLESAGVPDADRRFSYAYMGRYKYQSWEIEVPFALNEGGLSRDRLPGLVQAFHDMHERIYAIKDEEDTVEFTTWKVSAIGANRIPARARAVSGTADEAAAGEHEPLPRDSRKAYVHQAGGAVEVAVFDGDTLKPGAGVAGPCIIEERTTTIFLLPGMSALVNAFGDYEVTVE
jgi:N-methylhydantoinase A